MMAGSDTLGFIGRRWSSQLAGWEIPAEIVAQAPSSPWTFDPKMFLPDLGGGYSPSHLALLDLVAGIERPLVMDVGAGAGNAVLPVGDRIDQLLAVDQSAEMLETLAGVAGGFPNLRLDTRLGNFMEIASELPVADVVTCHHMVYNVADMPALLQLLIDHARVGVVLELTLHHPHYSLGLLWERFWGLQRPAGPSAADVIEALYAMGQRPTVSIYEGPRRTVDPEVKVGSFLQRLCLGAERSGEVVEAIDGGLELANPSVTLVIRA